MNDMQIADTPAKPSNGSGSLMRGTIMAAAGVAAATLLSSRRARAAVSPPLTFSAIPDTGDFKVLNYALALEALEADLYTQVIQRLTTGGTNALGITIPGLGLSDSEPDVKYAKEFALVEAQHRDFLDSSLGDRSILGTGTNGILHNAKFDFGIQSLTRQQVLDLLYTVESTGTQAYLGAIPSFATHTYLAKAAAIQGTEARHTATLAVVNNILNFSPFKDTAPLAGQTTNVLGTPRTVGIDGTLAPDTVLAAVSPWIVLPTT